MLDAVLAPRTLVIRPVSAIAAIALLLTVPFTLRGGAAADDPAPLVLVQFRLDAPGAGRVALAGDFTRWEPGYTLNEVSPGVWTVVVPLAPGVHDYAFLIDGEEWRPDPLAPRVDDGFGGANSRLAVLAPARRSES